jgi:hypothetical protein
MKWLLVATIAVADQSDRRGFGESRIAPRLAVMNEQLRRAGLDVLGG